MSRLSPPVGASDHASGPDSAGLTLVEFGDFQCPFCGAAYGELKQVRQAMGDRLRFVFRHFPLADEHPHALGAAMFAEAAGTIGRFWEMHDILFEHQATLDARSLARHARALDFGEALLAAALRGEFMERVRRDFSSGLLSGVDGTPTLFVNGSRYDGPVRAAALLECLNSR